RPSNLRNSWSYISKSLNVPFHPQFPNLFTDVLPIDLNAEVPFVIAPIEKLASSAVFVSEDPAIHAPVMNPLSRSLRTFQVFLLICHTSVAQRDTFFGGGVFLERVLLRMAVKGSDKCSIRLGIWKRTRTSLLSSDVLMEL
ncbi:hypothetical protein AOLI_G00275200, partial [Acnodon oligacanthus]